MRSDHINIFIIIKLNHSTFAFVIIHQTMHNKYNNGQIYIITAGKLLYVGSTIQELIKRERVHLSECKANKKNCDSFPLLRTGAYKMEWYEDFPCNSKAELHRREGEVMLELMEAHKKDPSLPVVVNRRIAGRTKHEYYEATKDVQLAIQKKAYDADKDKYRARKRADYAKNPEKYRARTAKHMQDPAYRARKQELSSRPHTCEICGFVGTFNKRKRHQATATCKRIAEQQIAECMNDMLAHVDKPE